MDENRLEETMVLNQIQEIKNLFTIGDLVEVEKRTWSGINKPGIDI